MKHLITFLLLTLSTLSLYAQSSMGGGKWQDHLRRG